ncbi:hypothetical protein [Tessaracoccus caeni]|uniref:hypothetical protein n=1 Tax=Tessaracoccus caeni TaxID=3031239 RepID=UPI0023DA605D|nr:hypothetical protein [Tessaracoccus caeni]MDF1489726.1 hypothetical protein [Tessaracoccus caeni]
MALTAGVVAACGLALNAPANAAPPVGPSGDLSVTYQKNAGLPAWYDATRPNGGFSNNPIIKDVDVDGNPLTVPFPDFQSFFDGGATRTIAGNPWGYHAGDDLYPHFYGVVDPIPDPTCVASQVRVHITGKATNAGPGTTWGSSAALQLYNAGTEVTYQWWGGEFAPGTELNINRQAIVPLSAIQGGEVTVSMYLESFQNIPEPNKAWDLSDFAAKYTVYCSPSAEDVQLKVDPGESGVFDLADKVITDTVDPDWSTLRLVAPDGSESTEVVIDGTGTFNVDAANKRVDFVPDPAFTGVVPPITYRIGTTGIDVSGFVSETAEAELLVTVGEPAPSESPSPSEEPSASASPTATQSPSASASPSATATPSASKTPGTNRPTLPDTGR